MTDPRLNAFLRLGQTVGGYADTPNWSRMMAECHEKQRLFIEHADIAVAGRGGGKSEGQARKFHRRSHLFPMKSSVFITLSAERSRDILLPALERLSERFNLGLREYRKANCMVWPNGYRVLFRGCKDRVEANKRRGTPWVEAGWDEPDTINSPSVISGRAPMRSVMRPAIGPATMITAVEGRKRTPACSGE